MQLCPTIRAFAVLLLVFPLSGCLFRSHRVEQLASSAPLKTATQQQLIDYIDSQAEQMQSMEATVDIDTSVGGEQKGKVTEYKEIRGFVLARKPSMLRMIGLMPIVRNRAFDMVSNGQDFKLWVPAKNRFIVGRNEVDTPNPKQPLENIRPQHIYDALLLRQIEPAREIAVMENETGTVIGAKGHKLLRAEYVLDVIAKDQQGWFLSRKIVFSRLDLLPHRQLLYDQKGDLVTDATYENYKQTDGVNFPWEIAISRPQEEYDITLKMVKLELNKPLPDDRFVLEQPPGVQVLHLDKPQNGVAAASGSDK